MSGGFQDHFSSIAADYGRYRPTYPEGLFAWLADLAPGRECAWDCACGTGQAALGLTAHFRKVVASDASAAQIRRAVPHRRVTYRVEPAEAAGLDSRSIDLVVVAQALHWFDRERFFGEARRVLKDQGILAVWSYGLLRIEPAIDRFIDDFYRRTLGPYWPRERCWVERGYQGIPWPFAEVAVRGFSLRERWSRQHLSGYLGTWSAVQRFRAATNRDPVVPLLAEIGAHWGDPAERKTVTWPLALRVGRKPGPDR